MENFLTKLGGSLEAIEKYLNPIKSNYQKNLESRGWEFLGNEIFYSIMDNMEPLELVWRDDVILARNSLREKMGSKREWYREIESAEKVRFFRAYDTSGERIQSEKLCVGVYVKRVVS